MIEWARGPGGVLRQQAKVLPDNGLDLEREKQEHKELQDAHRQRKAAKKAIERKE